MKINYIKKTLSNGVKLYLFLDKNMKQYYVDYIVNYGSSGKWYDFYLDNKYYHVLPGCAHFLEHLLGEHSKYGNYYEKLVSKKYFSNATTAPNITHYYFRGIDDILKSIEEIINVIDDPIFSKEDVEETRYAIAEETKRGLNNKYDVGFYIGQKNLFKTIDLIDDTLCSIGNEKTTYGITYDMLKACYDAFYYDENKILLIGGNFDEKEITDYVESIYAKLKPHKNRYKEYKYRDLDKTKNKYEIYNMSTSNDLITVAFKLKNSDYTKKEMVAYNAFIIGNLWSNSSDFVERLKKENILIDNIGSDKLFVYNDFYTISIQALVTDTKIFEKELIKEFKTRDFKERDFDLWKRVIISSQAYYEDNKYKRLANFAYFYDYDDDFQNIEFFKTLTYDKFMEFYKKLDFDNYVVSIIKDNN